MAYVNGMNGNNYTSGIYQNRNVLTGLASGMDTESMIENAMSGYKAKLDKLMQSKTKTAWQQESYRNIITKMAEFADKYTSYASPTNLMSGSFFNSAVNITTMGTYKDMISASGQTSSDVQILGVKKLATSARYTVSGIGCHSIDAPSIQGEAIDLTKKMDVSTISGTMSINYGGSKRVDISFSKDEIFKDDPEGTKDGKTAQQKLVDAINDKLSKQTITIGESTYKASEKIQAKLSDDGKQLQFMPADGDTSGNSVYVSGVSGDLSKTLSVPDPEDKKNTVIDLFDGDKAISLYDDSKTVGEYISGKTLSVNLNGVSKEITLPTFTKDELADTNNSAAIEKLRSGIESQLDTAFGKDKIEVSLENGGLKFTTNQKGSTLILESTSQDDPIKALGFGKDASTFVDTRKGLGDIFGEDIFTKDMPQAKAQGKVSLRKGQNGASDYYVDEKGYRVVQDKNNKDVWLRVDDKGEALYDLEINGEVVGSFNKDSQMVSVMNAINGNSKAGVNVSYSRTTDQFAFTAKESGANGKIEMGEGLAQKMFGATQNHTVDSKAGEDAVLTMKINGETLENFTHSSNEINIDGLTVKLKDTFGYADDGTISSTAEKDAVSFKATSDGDKIVDAVKSMIEDYNAMVKEIKDAYSTLPEQNSKGKYYEPLTEKQLEGMSESAIKAYEEKAKKGLLFGDRDLSSLYDRLRTAVSPEGKLGADLRSIGITVEYSNGLSTLKLDEQALRQAIDTTPDKVKNVFTQSVENGGEYDGLMQAMKKPLDMYGKVHGTPGILVDKAGSPLAPSSIYTNMLQQKMNDYDSQIEKLQSKMNAQIDRYTRQFSQMEQLIAVMNSQSASLAGLMGGF